MAVEKAAQVVAQLARRAVAAFRLLGDRLERDEVEITFHVTAQPFDRRADRCRVANDFAWRIRMRSQMTRVISAGESPVTSSGRRPASSSYSTTPSA